MKVLVTGVSGFLGGHIALKLLACGHSVNGTVRNPAKRKAIQEALRAAGADTSRLLLFELDLLDDRGWGAAAAASDCMIHVASPFVITMPKDANELIKPAVEGTRRALKASLSAGHNRIVLTSSLAAIDCGHQNYTRIFSEDDWTNLERPLVTAYAASKTLAEREAWNIVKSAQADQRLAVINPGALLGPLIDDDPGTSAAIVLRMLKGGMPMAPNIILEYVDVRDVAAVHVAALTAPAAGGKRHIIANGSLSLMEIAQVLGRAFPQYGKKLPHREMAPWLAGPLTLFDKSLRDSKPFMGIRKRSDSSRSKALLETELIPVSDSVIATARSMIDRKLT